MRLGNRYNAADDGDDDDDDDNDKTSSIHTTVIKIMGQKNADIWKIGCYWAQQYITLGYRVTVMSQFLLVYVIFGNISSACAKKYLTAAMY